MSAINEIFSDFAKIFSEPNLENVEFERITECDYCDFKGYKCCVESSCEEKRQIASDYYFDMKHDEEMLKRAG